MMDNLPVRVREAEIVQRPAAPAGDPVAVYLGTLGSGDSRRTMSRSLDRLAELLVGEPTPASEIAWWMIPPDRTTYLRAALLDLYAVTTVRKMLAALSGVLEQCWRLGLMEDEAYRRAIAWGKVRGTRLAGAQAGRHVEQGELRALFDSCALTPHPATGARNAALLATMYGAGCRRGEVVAFDLEHYEQETGKLTVHGKGNKVRLAHLNGGGRAAMDAWIRIRGQRPGPLFLAVNKGGRIDPDLKRMTTQAVYAITQRLAALAKIARFAPHDLRRSFVGDLLDAGVDLATAQQMAGHASLATTVIYDRRGERTKVKAAEALHVPYVEPSTLDGLD